MSEAIRQGDASIKDPISRRRTRSSPSNIYNNISSKIFETGKKILKSTDTDHRIIIFHRATIDTENRKRPKSIGKGENKSLGRNRTMTHRFLLNRDKDMSGLQRTRGKWSVDGCYCDA